jgi:hypothetical protein
LLVVCPAAVGLPKFRGFDLRHNPAFPNTAAWFAAISARPAYQKVCSDDQTLQLLFQRMMGLTAGAAAAASTSSAAAAAAAAIAAFAKVGSAPTGEERSAEQVQKARTEVRQKQQGCSITQFASHISCFSMLRVDLACVYHTMACCVRVAHVRGGVRICRPMTSFPAVLVML